MHLLTELSYDQKLFALLIGLQEWLLQGILNGIDTTLWDPEVDAALPAPYSSENLEGKSLCKRYIPFCLLTA